MFLAIIGVTCGVACAIITADYFFVRKNKFSLKSIYQIKGKNSYRYTGGFNIAAVISFAVGALFYYLSYDPINYMGRNDYLILLTPTGASYITSFISYIVLSKVPAINKYLLKDREEIIEVESKKEQVA